VLITNMVMNTAQGHFNEHQMASTPWGKILSYGGVNFSMVLGLASQDCIENALEELGLDDTSWRSLLESETFRALLEEEPVLAKAA
jgi:hypothetical protein